MEFFRNEIVKFLLKIFIAMMIMDALSRTFLNPEKMLKKEPVVQEKNLNNNQQIPEKVKEDIRSADDLKHTNYENQIGYLGDPSQTVQLDVQICNSCGYKKNFEELKNFLESQITNLRVVSEEYPINSSKKILAKLLSYGQMGLMILLMFGTYIFQKLNMPEPEIYRKIQQHKMAVIFGLYFFGNTVSNMLTNSGAFEVKFNENLIFSKLEQGKFPDNYYVLNQLKSFFY